MTANARNENSGSGNVDWRRGGFEPESWIGLRAPGTPGEHRLIGRPVHPPLVVRLARRLATLIGR